LIRLERATISEEEGAAEVVESNFDSNFGRSNFFGSWLELGGF